MDFQKGEIMALSHYMLHAQISHQLKIPPKQSVHSYCDFKNVIQLKFTPSWHTIKEYPQLTDILFILVVKSNTHIPLAELHDKTNCFISK